MPDSSERILKLVTYGLGAILLVQLVHIGLRSNPLGHAVIPALPALAVTNSPLPPKDTKAGSTVAAVQKGSNPPPEKVKGTNAAMSQAKTQEDTNRLAGTSSGTNASPHPASNSLPATVQTTNLAPQLSSRPRDTRQPTLTRPAGTLSHPMGEGGGEGTRVVQPAHPSVKGAGTVTNPPADVAASTNSPATTNSTNGGSNLLAKAGSQRNTNNVASAAAGNPGTNAVPTAAVARSGPRGFPGMGPGGPAPGLPPEIQARVDRIVDSEVFAPVSRPLPMALLGIAGNVAFLRTPNGQTGVVKENEELGGIKLLRIGTNRVLVEEEGQKKELTIFSGLGGESLMPK